MSVQAVLQELVDTTPEIGLQVAAYLDGKLVVDAWAGVADPSTGRPVDGDTLFMISSTGKGIVATLVHLLAERGRIDYDSPVAQYWPEFGANGKQHVTVRDALAHKAGVPRITDQTSDLLLDWDRVCAVIADSAPMVEPGVQTAYHVYSFGYILGELIRRVDGRTINQFMHDELCAPLGIPDSMFFGVPEAEFARVAHLEDAPSTFNMAQNAEFYNQPATIRAAIPAMGGHMTARAIARHYALLAEGGELDGVRLLSPQTIQAAAEVQSDELDALFKVHAKRSMGYRLDSDAGAGAGPSAFGHVGGGGSFGYADPRQRFAIGFAKNYLMPPNPGVYFVPDEAPQVTYAAIARALDLPQ